MSDRPEICVYCLLLRDGTCPYARRGQNEIGRMLLGDSRSLKTMTPDDRPCAVAGHVLYQPVARV